MKKRPEENAMKRMSIPIFAAAFAWFGLAAPRTLSGLFRLLTEAIRTLPRRKEKAPFLISLPGLATQHLGRFRSRVLPPAALIPRLAPERCYSTTGIQIQPLALQRFYSIRPAKPTLLSEWTPF